MLEISQILLHTSHKPSDQLQKVILRSIYCIVKEVSITFIITSIKKIFFWSKVSNFSILNKL